jgi:hypothetical protein
VADACAYVRQAALGLQHAHERGMVHRDIKPHNLMLTPEGQVKILDFGLARFVSESPTGGGLTQVGTSMGTPDYIAPEQARDASAADTRADIYSLGCTLYSFLTGQPPFPGGDYIQKVMAHIERAPRPVSEFRGDVPPELERVVERMMAKDPAQRFQTPAEVAEALAPFTTAATASAPAPTLAGPPPGSGPRTPAGAPSPPAAGKGATSRRGWPWVVAALALLLVVAAGALALVAALHRAGPGKEKLAVDTGAPEAPQAPEVPKAPPTPAPDLPLAWPVDLLREGKIPAPDLANVKPLVRYNFSDPGTNWPVGLQQRLGVERGYAHGTYFLKGPKGINYFQGPGRGEPFSRFACEVVGRVNRTGTASWGLRLANGVRGERFRAIILRISRDGLHIEPGKREAAEENMPAAEAIKHRAIRPADETNRLLVVLRGRQLEVYVNSKAVCDPVFVPAELSPAYVALFCQFGARGGQADFERLTVWPADGLPTPESRGAVAR